MRYAAELNVEDNLLNHIPPGYVLQAANIHAQIRGRHAPGILVQICRQYRERARIRDTSAVRLRPKKGRIQHEGVGETKVRPSSYILSVTYEIDLQIAVRGDTAVIRSSSNVTVI